MNERSKRINKIAIEFNLKIKSIRNKIHTLKYYH